MNKEEKDLILNTYKWIKVKKFNPSEYDNDDLYHALNEHHIEETTFLINKIRELVNLIPDKSDNIKVIFDGFENDEQAIAFADWYSGSGEQDSTYWLEENSDAKGAYTDFEGKFEVKNNELLVPIKIYK